jgi:DNA-binding CsgD family transcriptional regulator
MIVGRAAHLRALDDALAEARAGIARVLILDGDAGSGKSTLLDHALTDASADMLVLTVSGHVAESDLPYAGLHQLLAPLVDAIDTLPEPQRHALAHALALEPGPPAGQLATASAVLRLITSRAEIQPVVIIADDFQWLDPSTRQTLVFVARRIDADAVAVLLARRDDGLTELDSIGVSLTVGPMTAGEARELLRREYPDLSSMVAGRIIERAAGMPLALKEMAAELTVGQRTAHEPLPSRLPIGGFIERLYQARLAKLDDDARMALLIAAFEDLEPADLVRALSRRGLDVTALDAAERSRLVRMEDGRCVFAHATVRAAIQDAATSLESGLAQEALAACFRDDVARFARYVQGSTSTPPEEITVALDAAARQALDLGGFAEAAFTWEAASVRVDHEDDRRRYRSAAVDAYVRAGLGPPALALLQRLVDDAPDDAPDTALARWQHLRVMTSMWSRGAPPPDHDDLAVLGKRLLADDESVDLGIDLLMALTWCYLIWGDYRAGKRLVDGVRSARPAASLAVGHRLQCEIIDVMVGESTPDRFLLTDWVATLPDEALRDPAMPVGFAGLTLGRLDDIDGCARVAQRYREVLQAQGSFAAQFSTAALMAMVHERRGEWDRAALEYAGSTRFVSDSDFTAPYPYMALRHAYLLAAQGKHDECADLRERARVYSRTSSPALEHLDACAEGLLHLVGGRYSEAADALAVAAAVEVRMGARVIGYTTRFQDQFEALWRLGRAPEMAAELDDYEAQAGRTGHATGLSIAARCRALLAGPGDMDDAFERVLRLQADAPSVFETARTYLYWGVRLRRARRKGDARLRLLEAERIFERLDAVGWLVTTRSELAACGQRRASVTSGAALGPLSSLTPREFEVAQAVADGATNPEAAERLFISQRTVEYHLSSVYRKLDVTDRRRLAAMFEVPAQRRSESTHDDQRQPARGAHVDRA